MKWVFIIIKVIGTQFTVVANSAQVIVVVVPREHICNSNTYVGMLSLINNYNTFDENHALLLTMPVQL